MARKVPRTPAEFSRVSGVGRAKLEDLGGPFLDCINAYAREQGWPESVNSTERATPVERVPRAVNLSYRETGRLISGGASLDEVAEGRSLAVTTILGHLERLVEEGVSVEWAHLLPPSNRRGEIEAVFQIVGDELLRPVFDELRRRIQLQRDSPDAPGVAERRRGCWAVRYGGGRPPFDDGARRVNAGGVDDLRCGRGSGGATPIVKLAFRV